MKAALFLALPLAVGPFAHAQAQSDDDITPEEYALLIDAETGAIYTDFLDGDRDGALARAIALNDEVDQFEDFMAGDPFFWLPDLLLLRISRRLDDIDTMRAIAAPMILALDTPEDRRSMLRLEAMFLLALALFQQGAGDVAEPLLREFDRLTATPGHGAHENWVRLGRFMLAAAATDMDAHDAADLRRAVLGEFHEDPDVPPLLYVRLWERELMAAREAQRYRNAPLLRDAREAHDYLKSTEHYGDLTHLSAFHGLLSSIFAEHQDFARAEEISAIRVAAEEARDPDSPSAFFARQQAAGILLRKRDHAAALAGALDALERIEGLPNGQSEAYAVVRGSLERLVYQSGRWLDAGPLAQEALARSYAAFREVYPSTDPIVREIAAELDLTALSAAFAYAAELGVETQEALLFDAKGEAVLSAFWAGRYAEVGRALAEAEDDGRVAPEILRFNRALYHALLGEVEAGEVALGQLMSSMHPPQPGQVLSAGDPQVRLVEALVPSFGRHHDLEGAARLFDALATSTGDPQMRAIAQIQAETARAFFEGRDFARDGWAEMRAAAVAEIDDSAWGTFLAKSVLQLDVVFQRMEDATALGDQLREAYAGRSDRALALNTMERALLTGASSALERDRDFQLYGLFLKALESMLPREHQWRVASRVAYAHALADRGQPARAADLMGLALAEFRMSPEHRADTAAFISLMQAQYLWRAGEVALGQSIITELYRARGEIADWDPGRVAELYLAQAEVFTSQEAYEEALVLLDAFDAELAQATVFLGMRSVLLRANVLAALGERPRAETALTQGIASLPDGIVSADAARASLLRSRAYLRYEQGASRAAFTDMGVANDLHFKRLDALAQQSGNVRLNRDDAHSRAIEEARMGWQLAAELDG
ncbi:MAG: hypothetical protein AAF618_06240 [Pseudomonadota bacterium]